MIKYWISSIFSTICVLFLTSFIEASYARTKFYSICAIPQWEEMPEVANILFDSYNGELLSQREELLEDVNVKQQPPPDRLNNKRQADKRQAETISRSPLGRISENEASEGKGALNQEEVFVIDTTPLTYPIPKKEVDEFTPENKDLYFKVPREESIAYDPNKKEYTVSTSVGGYVTQVRTMDFDEYLKYDMQRSMAEYWKSKSSYSPTALSGINSLIPGLNINMGFLDDIFGKDFIKFDLNGSVELIFSLMGTRRDDPSLSLKDRKTVNFNFDSKIDINLNAKIGDRIDFNISHNTEAFFQFDNKLKLRYEGKEDEIIKYIEAGNISMPLNTTLIQGVQDLFGVKARFQFGNTFITGVFSEQKSESQSITVEGGAQSTDFEFSADDYEENRHYFVGQYFRDYYRVALKELPLVNSRINITKVEVWVTNIGSPVENNRNIVAFTDLGETKPFASNLRPGTSIYPDNYTNNLLRVVDKNRLRNINTVTQYLSTVGYTGGREYEKVESARCLSSNEYTINSRLGFISLNQPLNSDQVLAVAYQYQIIGDSTIYQVGELAEDGINDPQSLIVKLLKATTLNTENPLWDLMMKNVYALNAYQISSENFRLNIMYVSREQGVPAGYFINGPKSGIPLIQVFGMDNLDKQQNRISDGVFDFIDGASTGVGYIQSDRGLIYFPYVEPFGQDLIQIFNGDSVAAQEYAFNELYTKTKIEAQEFTDKNRYYISGNYKSSQGSEISLGVYNLAEGSVKVTAGNNVLIEGSDYTVNYTAGIVQIINQGILNSGVPINISMESSNSFSMITKRLMGLRVEHFFSDDFYVGGTLINLHQAPNTEKVNYGEEPISNTMYGFDFAYDRESRWLTKAVDAILPFGTSSIPARINLSGEFAHFIPGHAKAIGKEGTTYIDDFEGAKSTINLKEPFSWFLASTPQLQLDLFPESANYLADTRVSGFNRAKLSWYYIDPIFYEGRRPSNITEADLSNLYSRRIRINEVFPNKEVDGNEPSYLSILNMAYYPSERGVYNYDVTPISGISAGINSDGSLSNPENRWAGIMRKIDNTNFASSNVEYIEFWVMDPFMGMDGTDGNPKHSGGKLYFNLGNISEDVLRDGRKSFEQGLPTTEIVIDVDTTQWGRVPRNQSVVNAFDNNPESRQFQDIGLDGLNDTDERLFYAQFLEEVLAYTGGNTTSEAYQTVSGDPSSDNYRYFLGGNWDDVTDSDNKIAERYKSFTNPSGNSPSSANNPESFPTQYTSRPNTEDISKDNTLSESESYYQYVVDLSPGNMNVGESYITDIQITYNETLTNGDKIDVKWYQFKIPIKSPDKVVGQIENFQSIRFMRMFFKDFKDPVILRFASLDLVKADWRTYDLELLSDELYGSTSSEDTEFEVGVVNIEENGQREPIPYVLPPGLERQKDLASQNEIALNEQSLSLKVLDLADGDARGVYKTTDYDFRQFKTVELFAHLEKVNESDRVEDGDVVLFIRMGTDFSDNYYEYEIPLKYTQWGERNPDYVWPVENNVEIDLETLVGVKEKRNALVRSHVSDILTTDAYYEQIGKARYGVKGTPTTSDIKAILIGIRNPKKRNMYDTDNGMPRSVIVWVNEFSLNDFNKKGGVAVTGRIHTDLGDLGSISLAGAYMSANFGSIDTKLTDLSTDNVSSLDLSVDLNMGKFIPPNAGINLPVHYDISTSVSNPAYNPLDPDVRTEHDLATYATDEEKKEVKRRIQDYTIRQNINFMNVRKERTDAEKEPMFWDVENINVSYAYSSVKQRTAEIEYNNQILHRGGLGYDFSTSSRFFEPFAETKMAENDLFAIISDFNLNYIPNAFSFSTEIQREYVEDKLRNQNPEWDLIIEPTYYKRFDWSRYYNFNYDITKSISITYSANADSYLNEPPGKLNTREKRDSVWQSFFGGGNMRNFDQSLNITYAIPINKLPYLDWVNANFGYNTLYRWEAGAAAIQDRLGNIISNSMNLSATASANFLSLYNKSEYLKKINNPSRSRSRQQRSNTIMAKNDEEDDDEDDKNKAWETTYKGAIRFLMLLRDVSVTWSRNQGTTLPGFMLQPNIFGNNIGSNAPGAGFALFGSQKDIRLRAAQNGWLSKDSLLINPYYNQFTENINAQVTIEPFRDFRITLNFGYSSVKNNSSYYLYNLEHGTFDESNPQMNGSFNVTNIMILTSFHKTGDDFSNKAYQDFLNYRLEIAKRLSGQNPNSYNQPMVYDTVTGEFYPYGYKSNSQDVMLASLLAAYNGISPNKVKLNSMSKFPLPNWSLTYNGLTKIRAVRKVFKNFSISHSYVSTYSIGSYTNNVNYKEEGGFPWSVDINGNFIASNILDGVVISEQFAPLIKFSATMKNDLSLNFEYRQSRQVGLSFINNQIAELNTKEWIVGAGYRIKNVGFKVKSGGSSGKKRIVSDIVLRADFSIRNDRRLLRKIDQNLTDATEGAVVTAINVYAEYEITKQFVAKVFYNMNLNNPHIASSYFTSNTEGGISIIYKLVE